MVATRFFATYGLFCIASTAPSGGVSWQHDSAVLTTLRVFDDTRNDNNATAVQVRRVEEQTQMLELLPLHATQIYECAVKVFPSTDARSVSKR